MYKVSNNVNLKISLAHEWLDNLAVIHLIKDFVFDSENIKQGFSLKESKQMRLLLEWILITRQNILVIMKVLKLYGVSDLKNIIHM